MKCSICLATYNKPGHLARVLESIFRQHPAFAFEVIVSDDGGDPETPRVCRQYPVVYHSMQRGAGRYRNPARARNASYRLARGEVVICQSDDVVHTRPDTIERLVGDLEPGAFLIATVINTDEDGQPCCAPDGDGCGDQLTVYTSPAQPRPLFFLGSLWRRDLYAAGGNDEEFEGPCREDVWFGLCLTKGLGLSPRYSDRIVGHHLRHPHCTDHAAIHESQRLFIRKVANARTGRGLYQASGGPWPWNEPESANAGNRETIGQPAIPAGGSQTPRSVPQ